MKQLFNKILSISMALVVLFSTMSFTISLHYCGENLVDSSIFSKLKSCGMEPDNKSDETLKSLDCSVTKVNCCSEELKIIKGQDELKISFDKISLDQHIFVAAFFNAYYTLFITSEDPSPSLNEYPPPITVRHIYKLDESYLI